MALLSAVLQRGPNLLQPFKAGSDNKHIGTRLVKNLSISHRKCYCMYMIIYIYISVYLPMTFNDLLKRRKMQYYKWYFQPTIEGSDNLDMRL